MAVIEKKSAARPFINFLGNDSKKSFSAQRDMKMDKNMRIEIEESAKEMASDMTKTMNARW